MVMQIFFYAKPSSLLHLWVSGVGFLPHDDMGFEEADESIEALLKDEVRAVCSERAWCKYLTMA